jgi:hypothetical protein
VRAGKNGLIAAVWHDEVAKRGRMLVGYVGEDGIKADTWYRVAVMNNKPSWEAVES